MNKSLLLLAILISQISFAQYATFSADTTRLKRFKKNVKMNENISKVHWIINGRKFHFGDQPIKIKTTPNKLDTIYFKGFRKSQYDTILCNISTPKHYRFFFNECCGAFNICTPEGDRFNNSIIFNINNQPKNERFMGIFGEAGTMIKLRDTITFDCRSAMAPNIYPIELNTFKDCNDSLNCRGVCLVNIKDKSPEYGYTYKVINQIKSFSYMPLNNSPIRIDFDSKSKSLSLNDIQL